MSEKTITKSKQEHLHRLYLSYRDQNLTAKEAIRYALRDLGLPEDFCIDDYKIEEDK